MKTKNHINDTYNKLADNYDTFLSVQKPWVRIACKCIWGFQDADYADELLSWLPDDFSGTLLDVPAGTALFGFLSEFRFKICIGVQTSASNPYVVNRGCPLI
jgi:hypothetical protein